MSEHGHTPEQGAQATGRRPAANWLPRGRPSRPTALEQHLLEPHEHIQAFAALEAELAEERERLAEVEARLAEQAVALARLSGEPEALAQRSGRRAARQVELWRRDPTTRTEYWLCHCDGFTVETRQRPIGIVEEVRFASRHDCPDDLIVRVGRVRPWLLAVAVDDIEALYARERRVVLRRDPRVDPDALPLRARAADAVRSLSRRLQRPHARPV